MLNFTQNTYYIKADELNKVTVKDVYNMTHNHYYQN